MLFSKVPHELLLTSARRSLAKASQRPRPEGKHYRLWSMPGDEVIAKEILAKQWTIEWLPGLNTGINKFRTIFALCDGVMILSEEKFEPDWNNPEIDYIYNKDGKKRAPAYMRYIHVIPRKRVSEFKLIDIV